MKLILLILVVLSLTASSQELPWDDISQPDELNTEDDGWQLAAENFRRHPLNLNKADEAELSQLPLLNPILISQFLSYREAAGALIHIHELQAVPGWTPDIIRVLIPFITVEEPLMQTMQRERWLKEGQHQFLLRFSTRFGEEDPPPSSNFKTLVRYRYSYRDRLQYGVVGDKDAGEPFFGPVQKTGFDFYSFHLFIRKQGILESIAIGDYTVNMGQGLIHWQRLAFGKGAELSAAKRQAPVIHPYQSAGEYAFHRGLALGFKYRNWRWYAFISKRKLSATIERDDEGRPMSFSTIRTSGIHVSSSEQAGRNQLGQMSAGSVLRFQRSRLTVSWNSIVYRFSIPMQKQDRPANRFAIRGNDWWNTSIDYSYTWKNLHLFGELAVDRRFSVAGLHGTLLSLSSQFDVGIIRRDLSIKYQSVAGQAFTENTMPGNERGLYISIDWRPFQYLRIQAFSDFFLIPWIRSTLDRPNRGGDHQVQVNYRASRRAEFSLRWRQSWSQDDLGEGLTTPFPAQVRVVRFHHVFGMSGKSELRHRVEWKQVRAGGGRISTGWLQYVEGIIRPQTLPWELGLRLQFFDTDGYGPRIYAYERDVLYFNALNANYDRGWRYYILIRYKLARRSQVWVKWGSTIKVDGRRLTNWQENAVRGSISELRLQFVHEM